MSIVDSSSRTEGQGQGEVRLPGNPRALHRLAIVRRLQGISRHTLARRMNVEVSEVAHQEEETADLPLSKLYEWQKALDVPVAELLIESADTLAQPLMQRAQLVRLMKTALAIFEQSSEDTVRLMAQTLTDQLVEIMPELRGVSAWHTVGKRRRLDELGVAAERSLSEEVFIDLSE
jgi:transcriptional regulator with XRE-family HTH domain